MQDSEYEVVPARLTAQQVLQDVRLSVCEDDVCTVSHCAQERCAALSPAGEKRACPAGICC